MPVVLCPKPASPLCAGKEGQVRKAGKLLPKKEGWLDGFKPKQAQTFSAARNAPREKGFGGGGPWQKVDPKTPGADHLLAAQLTGACVMAGRSFVLLSSVMLPARVNRLCVHVA